MFKTINGSLKFAGFDVELFDDCEFLFLSMSDFNAICLKKYFFSLNFQLNAKTKFYLKDEIF